MDYKKYSTAHLQTEKDIMDPVSSRNKL